MKRKVINLFKALSIFSLSITLFSCAKKKDDKNNSIEFYYQQGTETDYRSYMYYSDDYFKESNSSSYNPSLATASLCLAMSSFASNRNSTYNDYSYRYRNAYDLMTKIGLNDIEVNSYYLKKPETDSIGLIFGNKKIFDKTLVVVGIRGANYESEWASNCTMGDTDKIEHQGFYDSASIYLNDLKSYIEKQNITGDIILWSSGYSRASAVNNLAAGRIDRAINNHEKILGDKVNIKKEDLYAYCFEVPMGASFDEEISPRDEIYNNIFNIVNPSDVVPLVAPKYLGYTRYGVDHYLPSSNLEDNYDEMLDTILSFYTKMENYDNLGEYKISSFKPYSVSSLIQGGLSNSDENKVNWTLSLFLNEFVDTLSEIGIKDKTNYFNNIQNGLRYTFSILYGEVPPKYSLQTILISVVRNIILNGDIDYLLLDLIHNVKDFPEDIIPYIIEAVKSLDENIDAKELVVGIKGLLSALGATFSKNLDFIMTFIHVDNIKAVASAHFPELCLAHMMAQDPNYTSKPISYDFTGSYYKVVIPYTDDLSFTISNQENEVVKVTDGSLEKVSSMSYGIVGENLVCYLPTNSTYEINGIYEDVDIFKFDQTKKDLLDVNFSFLNGKYIF